MDSSDLRLNLPYLLFHNRALTASFIFCLYMNIVEDVKQTLAGLVLYADADAQALSVVMSAASASYPPPARVPPHIYAINTA
jgi:hypothetical protein